MLTYTPAVPATRACEGCHETQRLCTIARDAEQAAVLCPACLALILLHAIRIEHESRKAPALRCERCKRGSKPMVLVHGFPVCDDCAGGAA